MIKNFQQIKIKERNLAGLIHDAGTLTLALTDDNSFNGFVRKTVRIIFGPARIDAVGKDYIEQHHVRFFKGTNLTKQVKLQLATVIVM